MRSPNMLQLVIVGVALLTGFVASAQVVASAPYTVSVFATSIPGVDFAPDSIAILHGHVFVGYGDGAAPDGSDGVRAARLLSTRQMAISSRPTLCLATTMALM